jgi:hypothetical protein
VATGTVVVVFPEPPHELVQATTKVFAVEGSVAAAEAECRRFIRTIKEVWQRRRALLNRSEEERLT